MLIRTLKFLSSITFQTEISFNRESVKEAFATMIASATRSWSHSSFFELFDEVVANTHDAMQQITLSSQFVQDRNLPFPCYILNGSLILFNFFSRIFFFFCIYICLVSG